MKTLNTLIAASLLVISSVSFAKADGGRSEKNLNVPAAPSVWEGSEIGAPEALKFLKAKSAFVPVAEFVWGNPSEVPANLTMVPVAPFVIGDSNESAPDGLAFVKAKSALVPVAPFTLGEPSDVPSELSVK